MLSCAQQGLLVSSKYVVAESQQQTGSSMMRRETLLQHSQTVSLAVYLVGALVWKTLSANVCSTMLMCIVMNALWWQKVGRRWLARTFLFPLQNPSQDFPCPFPKPPQKYHRVVTAGAAEQQQLAALPEV